MASPTSLTTTAEDLAHQTTPLLQAPPPTPTTKTKTILYLAYGSNLCSETFLGKRGIKPLSSLPVHVPTLTLTFDLPGIPYTEPCFANTRIRSPDSPPIKSPYHKDRWQKGLIGVVYEVTPEDYTTIIATEGGGASYQDVLVECFSLAAGAGSLEVGLQGEGRGKAFSAHTLLAEPKKDGSGLQRPDPSYAQPSARYLNLITTGADEHSLPEDYKEYLHGIRPYTITTKRQRIGQAVFLTVWLPFIMFLLGLGKVFADKDGKLPGWLAGLMGGLFKAVWGMYDLALRKVFGDGERTIEDGEEEEGRIRLEGDLERGCRWKRESGRVWCEKGNPGVESGART